MYLMKKKFFSVFFILFSLSSSINAGPYLADIFVDIFASVTEAMFETIFELTSVGGTFKKYPYYKDKESDNTEYSPFIVYDGSGSSTKIFLESSLVYNTQYGLGNCSRLDGYLWRFFGLYAENDVYWDVDGSLTGNPGKAMGVSYLGGQLTYVKTNPFTWQMGFQFGLNYGLLDNNAFKLTNIIKSYPGANLEIEDRFSAIFTSDDTFLDNEVHLGVQMERLQIYGLWNYRFKVGDVNNSYHQFGGGLKLYL